MERSDPVAAGLTTLLLLGTLQGCLDEPPFRCQSDSVCRLEGYPGTCDRASSTCVYPSASCRGINSIDGYVDGQGNCVPAPNGGVDPSSTSDVGTSDASTGTTSDPTDSTGTSNESTETTDSGPLEESSTSSSSGSSSSTGGGCDLVTDITNFGTVSASTALEGYPATNGIDGDNTTSWFSGPPDQMNGTTLFEWTSDADRCIERIEVDDNSMHANPEFRVQTGFEMAVVRVLQDDIVVFEETVPLPGSPDGNYTVEPGGVLGSKVVLEVGPPENLFYGGFSEVRVFGDG